MNKKVLSILLVAVMLMAMLAGCGGQNTGGSNAPATKLKVGMVTDSGTIDDKSFNQGTWEGIKKYETEKGTIVAEYLQPHGETTEDYLQAIADLVDNGTQVIVTPGFKFEQAIFKAQELYKDVKFILIDGAPNDGNWEKGVTYRTDSNVAALFFAEQEAGFLVGVAAALSSKTGKVGFVGGMEIPPVQKFGWGYQAGVKYANDTYGTKAEVIDYVYQGTFTDSAAGQALASGMYNKGADIVFTAAGGVGVGVFSEAKERAIKGENVFVIGVDVDQYDFGKISEDANAKSITLTSAMKSIDGMTYRFIDEIINGKFEGGKDYRLSIKDDGVGIPAKNPNLSDETVKRVDEVRKAIYDGKITVPSSEEALKEYLGK
ncbi:MAG: BMP family ABC transporter substrate-binding protein [Bacillota bacterium]|nr:BMP family ABC transporter substrate-binding protein [Bacillota bacterium]